jgi:DNA-binding response OmpR family regulator
VAQILIIDDDTQLAQQLALHLQQGGHQCDCETSAERALARLDDAHYGLVILDVMLPGLSGFEFCRRVRASEEHFTLPILMVSGMASREEMLHGLAQGADDFLAKPLRLKDILDRSANLLQANTQVDTLTELAGARTIKMELQRALGRQQTFAAIYAEIINLSHFARAAGPDGREKTVRHMGRALQVVGKELEPNFMRIGHLGGGHFLCLLDADKAMPYCEHVQRFWQGHLPSLYEQMGRGKLLEEAREQSRKHPGAASPLLDLLLCITVRQENSPMSVQEMLDQMSALRRGALAAKAQGIYCDRRQGKK